MRKTRAVTWIIRDLTDDDRQGWEPLFRGYREFYLLPPDDAVIETVWGWLMDPAHEVDGLIAEDEGIPVGIAHHRPFARPSAGSVGRYLDDLFVDAPARGIGIGRGLIEAVADVAVARGETVVRWITAETNTTARSLYDRMATGGRISYDLTI